MEFDKFRSSPKLIVATVIIGLAVAGTIAFAYSTAKSNKSISSTIAEDKADLNKQTLVQDSKLKIQDNVTKAVLKVDGMSCSGCIYTIKSALAGIAGIKDILVNVGNGEAEIYYDKTELKDVNSISTSITNSGYPAKIINVVTADEMQKEGEIAAAKVRNYIASVGGFDISREDFNTELNFAQNRYVQIYGKETLKTDQGQALLKSLKAQVVSRLINEGIQMQEIQRSGFAVDSNIVKAEFKKFLENMNTDLTKFNSEMNKRGYSPKYFRKKFEMQVLINKYLDTKILIGLTNDSEKQQQYSTWFTNARLLAKVVYYDRELERLVQAQSAGGGCSGGSSCSTRKSNNRS